MSIILLISDFQTDSFKIGILKSELRSALTDAEFIDITHQIRLNNTIEAAFVCKQSQAAEIQGSITLVKVGFSREMIVYQHLSNLYIFPNNGLISMVFDEIDKTKLFVFEALKEAEIIAAFEKNTLSNLPVSAAKLQIKYKKIPQIQSDIAVAECLFTDGNGNCYFNITADQCKAFIQGKKYQLRIQHYTGHVFDRIGNTIDEVGEGVAIFTFSKTGYLKLQINLGNAKQLFRIKDDTKIIIETR